MCISPNDGREANRGKQKLCHRLNIIHDDVIHSSSIDLVNVDRKADGRARLPVNEDIGEHGRAGNIKTGWNQKTARASHGLNGLVDSTGTDVFRLRRLLAAAGLPEDEYVTIRGGSYYWTSGIPYELDAHRFETLLDKAEQYNIFELLTQDHQYRQLSPLLVHHFHTFWLQMFF